MNFKDNTPIYLQVADAITDDIISGRYTEDGRIPSARDFAVEVEVNVNTVVHSYDYLQSNEIIYNKRGLGYFVSSGAKTNIMKVRRSIFLEEDIKNFFRTIDTLGISLKDIESIYKKYKIDKNENDK